MASALDTLLSGTTTSTTTLPSWYDQAQQNVVANAQAGANALPALQNTVAGQAINTLNNPATNPFLQAQGTLNTIAQGAANPFTTSATGQVTPNTNTPLGGLFAAQNQQLQTLIPQTVAPADAAAISGGQFGSLRNATAADTALTNAQANLAAQQMQAALQNQQAGVNAASGLTNVGSAGTATETTLGQAQQAAPLTATSDLAQILGTIKAPTAVTESATLPLAGQIGAMQNLLGASGLSGLLQSAGNAIFGSHTGSDPSAGSTGQTNTAQTTTTPTDTSGSTAGTFPSILGQSNMPVFDQTGTQIGGSTDTGTYTPIDTNLSPYTLS